MPDLSWRDAITKVLKNNDSPVHYTEIAEAIAERGLRSSLGATPASTVASTITTSMKEERADSPFVRVSRGYYSLRESVSRMQDPAQVPAGQDAEATGLVNAFGMYWTRNKVRWKATPHLLGQQQLGSTEVDFAGQRGVYMLHDGRSVVYVGRTTEQPLGTRLRQHTLDRMNGRWDRFSWFGVYPVSEDGSLSSVEPAAFNLENLIVTMEALLIEGLEPPQNRKRGDDFTAIEFLQVEDPVIQRDTAERLLKELLAKKL